MSAILGLAVCVLLVMAEWGARQTQETLAALGFLPGETPCQSTLHRLFVQLDGATLAQRLTAWCQTQCRAGPDAVQGVAIDGKAQRGRLQFAADGPVHVLSAFCHEAGIVLGQVPITVQADTSETELTVVPVLVDQLDWHGRVLTGDALFCQRALCQQVCDAGGDYLLIVKENQPTVHAAIVEWFGSLPELKRSHGADARTAHTIDTGHGRRPEERTLIASTGLTAWSDWPGLAQVFRIERTWIERGTSKRAVRYGITSLAPEIGTPERLLALKRGHWLIENRLHWCKDQTFGEDASLIHVGQGPQVMATLRDTAVSLLHQHGIHRIAATLRAFSQCPDPAMVLDAAPLTHEPFPSRALQFL